MGLGRNPLIIQKNGLVNQAFILWIEFVPFDLSSNGSNMICSIRLGLVLDPRFYHQPRAVDVNPHVATWVVTQHNRKGVHYYRLFVNDILHYSLYQHFIQLIYIQSTLTKCLYFKKRNCISIYLKLFFAITKNYIYIHLIINNINKKYMPTYNLIL